MIDKHFEDFILAQSDTFLIPAEKLAVLIDTHNVDHAKLVLSHITYSRVPVVTQEGRFVGTIGLTEISKYQMENDLADTDLQEDIAKIAKKDVGRLKEGYSLTQVMHDLIEEPFLPVVDAGGYFKGIITRKAILKAINSLLHDFTETYQIRKKA